MDRKILISATITLIIGAFLLGTGLTGMVAVGSSCCFGPTCPIDTLCSAAKAHVESPTPLSPIAAAWFGTGIIILTLTYIVFYESHRNNNSRNQQ